MFTHGIRYLKNHAMTTIDRQGQALDEMDVHWVITVPAIWTDAAKQFMREAAHAVSYCHALYVHSISIILFAMCFLNTLIWAAYVVLLLSE